MPFYVPVGPRGLIFRAGCFLYGIVGGYAYWRSCRRRGAIDLSLHVPIEFQEA